MSYLIRLGYQNLWRHKRRTIITLLGIAVSLGVLLFTWGMMAGIGTQSEKNLIDYQTAHLRVSLPGYEEHKDTSPLDYLWGEFSQATAVIAEQDEVEALTARLSFPARLNDGENELPCRGMGIDLLGTDEKVFRLKEAIVAGRYLKTDEQGMLLGDELAKLFQVGAGDYITVVVRTRHEAIEAMDLKIAGIVKTGNPRIDKNVFFIPLALAQSLVEAPNEITEIAVRIKKGAENDLPLLESKIKAALQKQKIDSEVFRWQHLAADFVKTYDIEKKATAILLGLIVIIAAVGITNTMVMVTFERTREIGTLMALGMRRGRILTVFLTEGAILGAIGSFLGCLWGGALTRYFEIHGIDLMKWYGNMDMPYPIKDYMYTELTSTALFSTLIFGIVITVIASFFPALRASHLNPAQALRYH